MDKAKKLRSELIAHIQSEAAKANSGDSIAPMSPLESSLFENRIRLFMETNSSLYEEDIRAALNEIYSTKRESSDFWNPILEVTTEKLNIETETNR